MRSIAAIALLAATCIRAPAFAAEWVRGQGVSEHQLRELCARVSGVTSLARTQIVSAAGEEWRRRSRQALSIESFTMGFPPLDPTKCYVIVRTGEGDDTNKSHLRRAFEAYDFAHGSERTLIMVVGRHYSLPTGEPIGKAPELPASRRDP